MSSEIKETCQTEGLNENTLRYCYQYTRGATVTYLSNKQPDRNIAYGRNGNFFSKLSNLPRRLLYGGANTDVQRVMLLIHIPGY